MLASLLVGCTGDVVGAAGPGQSAEPGGAAQTPGGADGAEAEPSADSGSDAAAPAEPGADAALAPDAASSDMNAAIRSVPDLGVIARCDPSTPRDGVRRLSATQLLRSMQTVFPSLFEYHDRNDPDSFYRPAPDFIAGYPENTEADVTENLDPLHSEAQMRGFIDIADEIGARVATSSAEKQRYAGTCLEAAQPSAACWRTFVSGLGRALWRRPLASAEIDHVSAQVPAGEVAIAMRSLVLRLMTAPEAMFLIERGSLSETNAISPA